MSFFWGQEASFGGGVREEEEGNEADEDGNRAFDEEDEGPVDVGARSNLAEASGEEAAEGAG